MRWHRLQGWRRLEGMASTRRYGVDSKGRHRLESMASTRRGGVDSKGWHRLEGMASTRRGGVDSNRESTATKSAQGKRCEQCDGCW
ncbi:hypothetical protein BD626DRAFT_495681 [Schizophyllum amplum]|uniref:Uncharacterized protein n=1 Tax=Schizophyllum amplum TaxID=97359 RepID=A0A550CEC5_9AGAR|nr:hypothetical protein BD626DRAFT_495681 [Auriculariopsis ampla]